MFFEVLSHTDFKGDLGMAYSDDNSITWKYAGYGWETGWVCGTVRALSTRVCVCVWECVSVRVCSPVSAPVCVFWRVVGGGDTCVRFQCISSFRLAHAEGL